MDLVAQILAFVATQLATMIGYVQAGATSLLTAIGGYLQNLASSILAQLSGVFNNLAPIISQVVSNVVQSLGSFFGPVLDAVTRMVDTARNWIGEVLSSIRDWLVEIWQSIKRVTFDVLESIGNFISALAAGIRSLWDGLMGYVRNVVDDIRKWLNDIFNRIWTAVKDVLSGAWAWIQQGISALWKLVQDWIAEIIARMRQKFEQVFGTAGSVLEALKEKLSALREAFKDAAETVIKRYVDYTEDMVKPFREAFETMAEAFGNIIPLADYNQALQSIDRFVAGPVSPQMINEFFADGWTAFAPRQPIARNLFLVLAGAMASFPFLHQAGTVKANLMMQDVAMQLPWQPLPPAEAVGAWRRDARQKGEMMRAIQRSGFSLDHAAIMMDNTSSVPAEGDLIGMLLRGVVKDAAFDAAMHQRGYDGAWAGAYRAMAQVIPPIQDLIVMAVKDVWNPAATELGNTKEAFPKELAEWSAKQGLSADWALKYWQAHWSLPSPNQGFEMLHRDEISDKDLDTLLQLLDIAPGWRPPLKAIAYNVLTRVDVRRMHKLGVLTPEEVEQAYRHMGYNARDAARLREFTIQLNKPRTADDDTELGKITRSAVLQWYSDGLLNRQAAFDLLTKMGSTAQAANLYLDSEDLSSKRTERRAETDHIIELAQAGALTFAQAQDRLNNLGLETLEVERALTRLIRATEKVVKLPTRAEGEKMWLSAVINEADYRDLLNRLGYAPRWIEAYVALGKVAQDARAG